MYKKLYALPSENVTTVEEHRASNETRTAICIGMLDGLTSAFSELPSINIPGLNAENFLSSLRQLDAMATSYALFSGLSAQAPYNTAKIINILENMGITNSNLQRLLFDNLTGRLCRPNASAHDLKRIIENFPNNYENLLNRIPLTNPERAELHRQVEVTLRFIDILFEDQASRDNKIQTLSDSLRSESRILAEYIQQEYSQNLRLTSHNKFIRFLLTIMKELEINPENVLSVKKSAGGTYEWTLNADLLTPHLKTYSKNDIRNIYGAHVSDDMLHHFFRETTPDSGRYVQRIDRDVSFDNFYTKYNRLEDQVIPSLYRELAPETTLVNTLKDFLRTILREQAQRNLQNRRTS